MYSERSNHVAGCRTMLTKKILNDKEDLLHQNSYSAPKAYRVPSIRTDDFRN